MILFAVSSYFLGGDILGREFVLPVDIKENGPVDKYSFLEQQLQQAPESENILEHSSVQESNGSLLHTVHTVQEHVAPSNEEPVGEPLKHTYASIVWSTPGSYFVSFICIYAHEFFLFVELETRLSVCDTVLITFVFYA